MISVTAHIDRDKLHGFARHADRLVRDLVEDGIEYGENHMTRIVPRGATEQLAGAVGSHGPVRVGVGHYVGTVGVSSVIAPYALKVDRGTGEWGPHATAVSIMRPARHNPRRHGTMMFVKKGELRFRRKVKYIDGSKILAGKNFSGRTHDAMKDWARLRAMIMAIQLVEYFQRR